MPPEDFLDKRLSERDVLDKKVREYLLHDHASGHEILWATDDYAYLGMGFGFADAIQPYKLADNHINLILPRVMKNSAQKGARTRQKAEVFTPSWVCNRQNNLVDAAWLGRPDAFNRETADGWEVNLDKITFPDMKSKTWKSYVDARRMEIACGEAPYLASRYDTVSAERIPVSRRIGILDRKLRVVTENTGSARDWFIWALRAVEACYGYEWQGDSLFLARENLLLTVIDHHMERFGRGLSRERQRQIAYRLSWNLWQMDARKGVIPGSCHDEEASIAEPTQMKMQTEEYPAQMKIGKRPCPGCRDGKKEHNGTYCVVRDWRGKKRLRYAELLNTVSKTIPRVEAGGSKP